MTNRNTRKKWASDRRTWSDNDKKFIINYVCNNNNLNHNTIIKQLADHFHCRPGQIRSMLSNLHIKRRQFDWDMLFVFINMHFNDLQKAFKSYSKYSGYAVSTIKAYWRDRVQIVDPKLINTENTYNVTTVYKVNIY